MPVYKKGDKEHTENYRPISLLPIVSKVLERCVLNNIKSRLYELVNNCQHGFITGKSCVTNLIEALEYIGSILDSGGQIDVIYLDMSKAFDKVNHQLLIHKLRSLGFGGNLLKWFRNYLTDRSQRVTVLGTTSDTLLVTSGVPQGSILGPALFLLYVNELPDVISSSQVAMFADDTKVFKAIKSADDASALQTDLSNLDTWTSTSGLVFNETKCRSQSVTRKTKPVVAQYKMRDKNLEVTYSERDLGVWVCADLSWKKQVLEQAARANKTLGYIKRNSRCISNTSVKRTIYLTLVRPHLGYATQIWAPQSVDLIVRLERTQRRATKFILGLPFTTMISYASRLQSLSLLPICYWHEYLDLVFLFKITHGLVNVKPSLIPRVRRNIRHTKSSNNPNTKYVVPKSKTTTYQRSFLVRVTRTWNILADEFEICMDNLNSFKSVINKYYFTSLATTYDPDNPRTFKIICCKCNTPRSLTRPIPCCF